jgi:hypothetical protein
MTPLVGWLTGATTVMALLIWWPRSAPGNHARRRVALLLQRAAACHVLGFLFWTLLLGIDPSDGYFFLILAVLGIFGAASLVPYALSMLGLDVGQRWLSLAGSILAVLFPAGFTVYALLTLLGIYAGGVPLWRAAPALGTACLGGASVWFVLEAYTLMRAPRTRPEAKTEE